MDPRELRKEVPRARKSMVITNRHQVKLLRRVLSQFTPYYPPSEAEHCSEAPEERLAPQNQNSPETTASDQLKDSVSHVPQVPSSVPLQLTVNAHMSKEEPTLNVDIPLSTPHVTNESRPVTVETEEESRNSALLLKIEALKKIRIAPIKQLSAPVVTTPNTVQSAAVSDEDVPTGFIKQNDDSCTSRDRQDMETDPAEVVEDEEMDIDVERVDGRGRLLVNNSSAIPQLYLSPDSLANPESKHILSSDHEAGRHGTGKEDDLLDTKVDVKTRGAANGLWTRLEKLVQHMVSEQVGQNFTLFEKNLQELHDRVMNIEKGTKQQIHKLSRQLQMAKEDSISRNASMVDANAATESTYLACATPPTPLEGPWFAAAAAAAIVFQNEPPVHTSDSAPISCPSDVRNSEKPDSLPALLSSCQPDSKDVLESHLTAPSTRSPVLPNIPLDSAPRNYLVPFSAAPQPFIAQPVIGPATLICPAQPEGHGWHQQASAELAGSAQAPATFPGMGFSVGPGSFTPAFVQNLTTSSLMPEGVASPAITYTIADACEVAFYSAPEGEAAVDAVTSLQSQSFSCTSCPRMPSRPPSPVSLRSG
ncbi:uncharacterized protein LOC105898702 isoform X2 [Clupea harengus]|uniref:Uncharacterized protein LOC105898702 isoform X2 n=1 Tax=Clupea harengus TaxID=7950 RepID=A0A6P8FI33_CLUHA|nr:uncharacterized protein LOC105898702 isoform X2 [Clupea harengus]